MTALLSRIREWLRLRERTSVTLPGWLAVDGQRHDNHFGEWAAEPSGSRNQHSAALAVAMYRGLADSPGDIVFSPFSLRVALAIALGGARGETAAELRQLLGVRTGEADGHDALGRLSRDLEAFSGDGSLGIANSLWISNAHPLTAEFEALASAHYRCEIRSVNLPSPAAAGEINRWIADRTFGRISDLIGELDADSRLILINALAFRGKWATPFPPDQTDEQPFATLNGPRMLVPMMFNTMRVRYAERQDLQAVDLEYRGGRLALLIVLPSANAGLATIERTLSAHTLAALDADLRVREVHVSLPRFTIGTHHHLVPLMNLLGVRRSFNRDSADFSGMNGRRPPDKDALFVSAIVQKAHVDVNEEGTEAVAATAIEFDRATSMPQRRLVVPVFRADHPFLFAIRDCPSGEILFIGRVTGSQFDHLGAPHDGDEFDSGVPVFPRGARGEPRLRGNAGGR